MTTRRSCRCRRQSRAASPPCMTTWWPGAAWNWRTCTASSCDGPPNTVCPYPCRRRCTPSSSPGPDSHSCRSRGSHTCRSHQLRHYWLPHARIQDSPAELAHQHTQRSSPGLSPPALQLSPDGEPATPGRPRATVGPALGPLRTLVRADGWAESAGTFLDSQPTEPSRRTESKAVWRCALSGTRMLAVDGCVSG